MRFIEKIEHVIELIDEGNIDRAKSILIWLEQNADRYTKVNLGLFLNAQSLIDMAKERLCNDASAETREIFRAIKESVSHIDPELAQFLVPRCIYRGGLCNSLKPCGYNKSERFAREFEEYKKHFS